MRAIVWAAVVLWVALDGQPAQGAAPDLKSYLPLATGDIFAERLWLTGGDSPQGVAMGDLDGDGDADLVATDRNSGEVSVLMNNGVGAFATPIRYVCGDTPDAPVVVDIDGDQDLDIVVAIKGAIAVLLNDGTGSFGEAVAYPSGGLTVAIAIGDIDGDGEPDAVCANIAQPTVWSSISVLRNEGGIFGVPAVTGASQPTSIALADLDGDGDLDMVSTHSPHSSTDLVEVRMNAGDGTFGAAVPNPVGVEPLSVQVGDLDGDGDLDIGVACVGNSGWTSLDPVCVLMNTGNGSFAPAVEYKFWDAPYGLAFADVDGDSDLDMLVGQRSRLHTMLNSGDGTFEVASTAFVPRAEFCVGDIDGDSDTDVVFVNPIANGVSVVLNMGRGEFLSRESLRIDPDDVDHVVVVDFDGDGNQDLVTVDRAIHPNTVGVVELWLRQHGGGFASAARITSPWGAANVGVGDLDGDGDVDLAIAVHGRYSSQGYLNDSVDVYLSEGSGVFRFPVSYLAGEGCYAIAFGDMDGDGDRDIVVAGIQREVSVLLNLGDGTFGPPATITTGPGVQQYLDLGDLDGDGDLDAVVTGNANFRVLTNSGAGVLTLGDTYPMLSNAHGLVVRDLDGDGDLDVATAGGQTVGAINVRLNQGNGVFGPFATYESGIYVFGLACADFDGDGHPDLATANFVSDSFSVLLNSGFGTFGPRTAYAVDQADSVAAGNMDKDGDIDMVVVSAYGLEIVSNQTSNRPAGALCPADIDGDAFATAHDFVILASNFGASVPAGTLGDCNGDGVVNTADFVVFAAGFGRACP